MSIFYNILLTWFTLKGEFLYFTFCLRCEYLMYSYWWAWILLKIIWRTNGPWVLINSYEYAIWQNIGHSFQDRSNVRLISLWYDYEQQEKQDCGSVPFINLNSLFIAIATCAWFTTLYYRAMAMKIMWTVFWQSTELRFIKLQVASPFFVH